MTGSDLTTMEDRQRRRARRNAILLGGVALVVYVGYMLAMALRG